MLSTLALRKLDYEGEVGVYLGRGRGEAFEDPPWEERDARNIRMDVASGLRRFYFCGHPWSFLKPMADLTLLSGDDQILLPEDFGGMDGGTRITVLNPSDAQGRLMIEVTGIGRVVQARSLTPTTTGIPRLIALNPVKNIPAGNMQRTELWAYPTADQDYTLRFPYLITPNYLLDVTQPYAYGGVEHHETILECCLAVAEQRRDDTMRVHSQKADEYLQRSIRLDQRKQPIRLGPNRDLSDDQEGAWGRYPWDYWNGHGWNMARGVTIDGVLYD